MPAHFRSALLVSVTCWLLAPHVISGQSRPAGEASHRKTVGTKKNKNSGTFILVARVTSRRAIRLRVRKRPQS